MDAITLMCIDDRPQLLELRKALLESHGYRVKMALSGHAAMKMLQDAPVAAVLLEYKTEGIDAEAIASHVKLHFPSIPIILVSAYACTPERILCLVDEYVMRSELSERLISAIERAIRRSRTDEMRKRAGANAA
ncbi:MAG: response regulator [Candidatus Sulfotelmatobacter sp.]